MGDVAKGGLAGRRVLVTGGTGSIGRAIVKRLSMAGHDVSFQYGSDEAGAALLANETGAECFALDLASRFEPPRVDFDVLVNSAGVLLSEGPVHEVPDSEYETTFAVNLVAPLRLARAIVPFMLDRGWGRIVNIGSIYSVRACGNNATYNASKHGLSGLTKSLAHDYAAFGITANDVCPAAVESAIMDQLAERYEQQGDTTADEFLDRVRAANPTGRMAEPRDIAGAVAFLVSDEAAFVNGHALVVDGGQTA